MLSIRQVYERFRDAGEDYDRLALEGRNLHSILNRISLTWQRQSDKGLTLSPDDLAELQEYIRGCQMVLASTNAFFFSLPRGASTAAEIMFRTKMVVIREQVTTLQEELKWYKNNLVELHNLILYQSPSIIATPKLIPF
jgi:hypothetical protein